MVTSYSHSVQQIKKIKIKKKSYTYQSKGGFLSRDRLGESICEFEDEFLDSFTFRDVFMSIF